MKTLLQVVTASLAFACWTNQGTAQPYQISWESVDAGSSTGAASNFRLSGTIGQPDAGSCLGGAYQLGGGFVPAFQKTVGPELKISRSFGAVILTWPAGPCAGFRLEASARVSGGPWMDLGEGQPSEPSGAERSVAVGASAPYQFFRLRKTCTGDCPQACRE